MRSNLLLHFVDTLSVQSYDLTRMYSSLQFFGGFIVDTHELFVMGNLEVPWFYYLIMDDCINVSMFRDYNGYIVSTTQ